MCDNKSLLEIKGLVIMSEANNKVRSAVEIFNFGHDVRFLYPFNHVVQNYIIFCSA